ncbi:MAG TPA: hypothetical protein VEX38_02990, partial [Fimbriimonadaceae bacterium]|nr:hypothetical protein [Fimbriimonadaceae bacterium]
DKRDRFLTFMRSKQPGKALEWVDLPPELTGLATRDKAFLYEDPEGRRFYSYAVFTHGVDNSKGFIFSESGHRPPRLAHPEITRLVPMDSGWFFFCST